MRTKTLVPVFAVLALTLSNAQDQPVPETDHTAQSAGMGSTTHANDPLRTDDASASVPVIAPVSTQSAARRFGIGDKFRYYLGETYLNPSFVIAPAFRAGFRMANPPGQPPAAYPANWRQGPEGFARNYGDAMAQRVSFHTARFATGTFIHEGLRYTPSASHNPFVRGLHAFGYTFIDRSDSGHRMPALSNFVGASAAGFVGNSYLPPGFANVTHAGQRATLQFGFFAAGNLYREFAPQMPRPIRTFVELIGR